MADSPQLESMLERTLDALLRRAEPSEVSFEHAAAGGEDVDEELWQLVELARGGDEAMSYATDAADDDGEGRLARLRRECSEFFRRVLESITSAAVVETPAGGATVVRTRVGWTGDTTIQAVSALAPATMAAHVAAVDRSLARSVRGVRILTMIVAAAVRIAKVIVSPAAMVTALPVAYRCVNKVYEQWRALSADSGETPWQ